MFVKTRVPPQPQSKRIRALLRSLPCFPSKCYGWQMFGFGFLSFVETFVSSYMALIIIITWNIEYSCVLHYWLMSDRLWGLICNLFSPLEIQFSFCRSFLRLTHPTSWIPTARLDFDNWDFRCSICVIALIDPVLGTLLSLSDIAIACALRFLDLARAFFFLKDFARSAEMTAAYISSTFFFGCFYLVDGFRA